MTEAEQQSYDQQLERMHLSSTPFHREQKMAHYARKTDEDRKSETDPEQVKITPVARRSGCCSNAEKRHAG
jgi:hypothetical protein